MSRHYTQDDLGIVSVKEFGAKGDGVTDDTNAIRNAISYAMNMMSISISARYAIGFKIIFPSGRYKVTEKITITRPANSISTLTGRGFQLVVEGSGVNTTIELETADGTLIEAYETSVVFRDIGLWAVNGKSVVFEAGKNETDTTNLKELRQSRFENVFFRGNVCIKANRIFDSSFYDCFFALSDTSGVGIDVISPSIDNSNNVNFRRCHFENGTSNGVWVRALGTNRVDGYHHGFNFDGCHFETRSYSMKVLEFKYVTNFSFYRCQLTQNINPNITDSITNAVNMLLLENSSTIAFDTCGIMRSGDVSTAPLLVKTKGYCNAITFRNVQAPTCGNGNGGRANLIDDSECTTKRGIQLDNCMLTSYTNKASNNDRLFISQQANHNRDWQIYTDNQNALMGYTTDINKDLLTKGDEQFGFSQHGQFKSKYGFTGLNVSIPAGGTYTFTLPTSVSANRRGLYMFNFSDGSGIYYGILSITETVCISVLLGDGVVNGGMSASDVTNKINVWYNPASGLVFKNNLAVARTLMITPFAFGTAFE